MANGKILQITGVVVDVEFPPDQLPEIYNALEVTRDDGSRLVFEVQSHLGNDTVRTVAMGSTDGLRRGTDVVDTGQPIAVPVGPNTLGRILNVLGEAIDEGGLTNVRVFTDDALKLLVKLPDASLDAAHLLYPDPWPKTRHHKRRFISPTTLGELARVLKRGSIFRFATDIEDYANWTLAHILREPRFRFAPPRPGIWHDPYSGWVPTRYEEKARLEGRSVSFYFEFERI